MLHLILNLVSLAVWLIAFACAAYLWFVAMAGVRITRPPEKTTAHKHRFAIAIPAHDEEAVIGDTVRVLQRLNYPRDRYDIFVVADYCTDCTAEVARRQGAICYERREGERGGKGAALSYLFERMFGRELQYDAVVVFDADTRVDEQFLRVMNDRLNQGAQVIQGQHVISNSREGWFPALTWAMMIIDNRFSNQGRANLHLSAKHMGDSICFRADVLRRCGWGSGLTEDYELRLRLLFQGIRIEYEPRALGYGQAPRTWREAEAQRRRWARGMADAGNRYRGRLLKEGIKQKDWSKLDAGLSTLVVSYSTLSFLSSLILLPHLAFSAQFLPSLVSAWIGVVLLFLAYPAFGLILVRAPIWAYLAILSGPLFILWRTWLNLRVRLTHTAITWVRTPHQGANPSS